MNALAKYFFTTVACFLSFAATSQNIINLRIDPETARGGTVSQIFDSIRFIPLETSKESIFGAVDQLEVVDSFFIVLDMQGSSVLLFDKKGKFHARIKPNGADKYFSYFTVDPNEKAIIIANNYADGLVVYDYKGNYLRTVPRPENIRSLYSFGNSTVYNFRRAEQNKTGNGGFYDLGYSKKGSNVTAYKARYNPDIVTEEYNTEFNPFNFSGNNGTCMFSLPFDYNVYELNDTGIVRTYKFIFPAQYSLPVNFSTDASFKDQRAKYVYLDQENKYKKHGISSTYRINDFLFFTAVNGELRINAERNYMYNLKTGSLVSFSRVTGDSLSSYLPVLSSNYEPMGTVNNGKIYTSTASFRIFSIKTQLGKEIEYPSSLKDFIATGNKTNNPVIIELVPKQNL